MKRVFVVCPDAANVADGTNARIRRQDGSPPALGRRRVGMTSCDIPQLSHEKSLATPFPVRLFETPLPCGNARRGPSEPPCRPVRPDALGSTDSCLVSVSGSRQE